MMERRALISLLGNAIPMPTFFNHLESGQFSLESGTTATWVYLSEISLPKGIVVYSNAFDEDTAKDDKPMLGGYAMFYIAGTDELTPDNNGLINIARFCFNLVNWGQTGNTQNPNSYGSRAISRGIDAINLNDKGFHVRGFGTNEYDFKQGVTYNWIAWD